MKNFRAFLAALTFAPLACVTVANAQTLPSPSALTLKAGVSVPSNADVQNSGFALGADYIFHPSSLLEPFNLSVYADLLAKSGGAGVAIRNAGPVYIGAGAGFYSTSVNAGSASGFGGKVFGGFDIAPHTTLEFGYHVLPKLNGVDTNVMSAQVGFRF